MHRGTIMHMRAPVRATTKQVYRAHSTRFILLSASSTEFRRGATFCIQGCRNGERSWRAVIDEQDEESIADSGRDSLN